LNWLAGEDVAFVWHFGTKIGTKLLENKLHHFP